MSNSMPDRFEHWREAIAGHVVGARLERASQDRFSAEVQGAHDRRPFCLPLGQHGRVGASHQRRDRAIAGLLLPHPYPARGPYVRLDAGATVRRSCRATSPSPIRSAPSSSAADALALPCRARAEGGDRRAARAAGRRAWNRGTPRSSARAHSDPLRSELVPERRRSDARRFGDGGGAYGRVFRGGDRRAGAAVPASTASASRRAVHAGVPGDRS